MYACASLYVVCVMSAFFIVSVALAFYLAGKGEEAKKWLCRSLGLAASLFALPAN